MKQDFLLRSRKLISLDLGHFDTSSMFRKKFSKSCNPLYLSRRREFQYITKFDRVYTAGDCGAQKSNLSDLKEDEREDDEYCLHLGENYAYK